MRTFTAPVWAISAMGLHVGLVVGCAASEPTESQCAAVFPASTTSVTMYVAEICASVTPDGTKSQPFSSIQAAIAAAPVGATIAVAPGTYAENLLIDKSLAIVGAAADVGSIILKTPTPADTSIILKVPAPDELGVIIAAPMPNAIVVTADGVTLQGLEVAAPQGVGIILKKGATTLRAVRVDGAVASSASPGQGIIATGGAHIDFQGVAVVGSAEAGIILKKAGGTLRHVQVSDSGSIGLTINGVTAEGVTLADSVIEANTGAGVGVFDGAGIILQNNAVTGTATKADGTLGDGIAVVKRDGLDAPSVEIREGNRIDANARTGVLFHGVETGIILKTEVSDNAQGGIWLQGDPGTGTGVVLDGLTVKRNAYAGVIITQSAAGAVLRSTVSDTREGFAGIDEGGGSILVGDGVGVYAGARAKIENNTIDASTRAGILLDATRAEGSTVSGNTVTGNRIGIILQHPRADGAVSLGENTATQNADANVDTNPTAPLQLDPSAASGFPAP